MSDTAVRTIAGKRVVPSELMIQLEASLSVNKIIYQLVGGLKSSMGYLGSPRVVDLRKKPKFVKITKAGFYESMVHNIDELKKWF